MFAWRYLSFESWGRLASEGRLPVSQLSSFEDSSECMVPALALATRFQKPDYENPPLSAIDAYHLGYVESDKYATCWFLDDHESIAMWDLYIGRDNERRPKTRVAIAVSVVDLMKLAPLGSLASPVRYVRYDDEGSDFQFERPELWPFIKNWGYRHEQEFRIVVDGSSGALDIGPDPRWGWVRNSDLLGIIKRARVFGARRETIEGMQRQVGEVPDYHIVGQSRAFPDTFTAGRDGYAWHADFNP